MYMHFTRCCSSDDRQEECICQLVIDYVLFFTGPPPLVVLLQPLRGVPSPYRRDHPSLPGYNALRVTPSFYLFFFTDFAVIVHVRKVVALVGEVSPPVVSSCVPCFSPLPFLCVVCF